MASFSPLLIQIFNIQSETLRPKVHLHLFSMKFSHFEVELSLLHVLHLCLVILHLF